MALKPVTVNYHDWHRLRHSIEAMQGQTFYCEDEDGVLRRWYPPMMPQKMPDHE